jgi:deazaflavin-dependent oxidoreductase (nitroreductase family)
MAEDQRNEAFVEPPRDEIPGISRAHVAAMEASDAEEVWVGAGMKQLLVQTVGRKTGNEHKVALPYWRDPDGHPIVVASFAGAPEHPAWYLNLADRSANPEVFVRDRQHAFWAAAQILDGAEYQDIWSALTADRPYYNDYQTRTERRIPLVRLVELRLAST